MAWRWERRNQHVVSSAYWSFFPSYFRPLSWLWWCVICNQVSAMHFYIHILCIFIPFWFFLREMSYADELYRGRATGFSYRTLLSNPQPTIILIWVPTRKAGRPIDAKAEPSQRVNNDYSRTAKYKDGMSSSHDSKNLLVVARKRNIVSINWPRVSHWCLSCQSGFRSQTRVGTQRTRY